MFFLLVRLLLPLSSAYFRHKIESINGYMKYRRLPPNLQRSVRNYYSYLWNSRRGLDESEVVFVFLLGPLTLTFAVRNATSWGS